MPAPIALALRGTDRVISLENGARLTVGRVSHCDVQLEDPSVSRRHCPVEVHGERLTVTDLESANGTFINERPIAQGTANPGDTVRLGSMVLEVRGSVPSGQQVPSGRFQTVMGGRADDIESVIRKRF